MNRRGFLAGLAALAISQKLPRLSTPVAEPTEDLYEPIQKSIRLNFNCRTGGVVIRYPASVRYRESL